MPVLQAPFDSSRDFIASRSFRAGGTVHLRDKPFDKSAVDERVLRLLYEDRSIRYSDDKKARKSKAPAVPTSRFALVDHFKQFLDAVVAHVRVTPDTPGAPGTTREVPGAEESTSALSGSASAPSTTAPAAGEAPGAGEAAAAPVGDAATAAASAADRDRRIEQLLIDHSAGQLVDMAPAEAGLTAKSPKAKIAAAIVDAELANGAS